MRQRIQGSFIAPNSHRSLQKDDRKLFQRTDCNSSVVAWWDQGHVFSQSSAYRVWMKSSDPTVLPLGPTPNSESQTLPPFVSVVSKGVRMRPNNSSRSAWRYFTQINEHKKGKNHTRLTHRLIHSSPTAAKITTSQRNHVLLLLDWLCPMTATDRFSFSPGRADSEPQLKQISIDLKAVGFTIIPFFFLCVFGHWALFLSTGESAH